MKKIYALFLPLALLTSCGDSKPAIEAHLEGMSNDSVIIQHRIPGGEILADTIPAIDGTFEWSPADNATRLVYISELGPAAIQAGYPVITMATIPGEHAVISGTPYIYSVEGSEFYQGYNDYLKLIEPILEETAAVKAEISKIPQGSPYEAYQEFYNSIRALSDSVNNVGLEFIAANPDKGASLLIATRYMPTALGEIPSIFTEELKSGKYKELYTPLEEAYNRLLAREAAKEKLKPGNPAPDFTLTDDKGGKLTLSSLQGKYVILDFWGSWCGWCIAGFPEMKKMYAQYSDRLEIVGIACNDTDAKWKGALEKNNLPWLNVLNLTDDDLTIIYAVSGYPTKVVIDPEGNIVKITLGEDSSFYTFIEELMK